MAAVEPAGRTCLLLLPWEREPLGGGLGDDKEGPDLGLGLGA